MMKKSAIRILIIEDDPVLGRALSEFLTRKGFENRCVDNPEQARSAIKNTEYHCLIVDCMLPKKNGVELVEELRELASTDMRVILTSGIFKDKAFTKDALQRAKATAFLSKPFDLQTLEDAIEEAFANDLEQEQEPLHESLTKQSISAHDCLKILESHTTVHGYDLPLIYSLMLKAGVTGDLSIVGNSGETARITFGPQQIVDVHVNDKTSYFGILLVEKGYASHDDVSELLTQDAANKPLGIRLVEAHALSPHAIKIVRCEQMSLRLSRTIQDTLVEIRFTANSVSDSEIRLTYQDFVPLLVDWCFTKIGSHWLNSFAMKWLEYTVKMDSQAESVTAISRIVDPQYFNSFIKKIDNQTTLQNLIDPQSESEDQDLRILHSLSTLKLVYFEHTKQRKIDFSAQLQRLKRMWKEMEGRTHYEILNLNPRARNHEINRNYHDIAKSVHPDKIEAQAPAELKKLANAIFARISEAYDVLSDETRRKLYTREIEHGNAEIILKREAQFERGQDLLQQRRFQEALLVFHELKKMKNQRPETTVYYLWAKIKAKAPSKKVEKVAAEVAHDLAQIPPEERHNAPYFYVKGLYYKMVGNREKSEANFRNAVALDPAFIEAKREYLRLKTPRSRNSEKMVSDEITSVMDFFFKKRRGA